MNDLNNNLTNLMGVVYLFSGQGGVYPGATTREELRKHEHLTALQNGTHWNNDFQRAANVYGVLSFVYIPYPPVPFDKLGQAEQRLYDEAAKAQVPLLSKRRPSAKAHSVGYKLSDKTRKKQARAKRGNRNAAKHLVFHAPDGSLVESDSLSDLCKKHGLNISSMSRVLHSKQEHHRGFRKST